MRGTNMSDITKTQRKSNQREAYKHHFRSKGRSSSTPGRSKGLNCQATPDERFFAKKSRSYKYPGYEEWCKKYGWKS